MKKIVFIVGSLRKGSFNHQLANIIRNRLEGKVETAILDWKEVPIFNQDLESDLPESVDKMKSTIADSDALWIITPEYNHQIPGALKNVLDWCSRGNPSVLKDKKVTFSSVAGNSAGASVRDQMMQLLNQMMMNVMSMPNFGLALTMQDFETNSFSLKEYQSKQLNNQIDAFLQYIAE